MDALAFSGPGGTRRLALALRELSSLLEAGSVSLYSVDTSSAIHAEEKSVQYIGLMYILPEGATGISPTSSTPQLNS
jgi:hypothetical protein